MRSKTVKRKSTGSKTKGNHNTKQLKNLKSKNDQETSGHNQVLQTQGQSFTEAQMSDNNDRVVLTAVRQGDES